MFIKMIIFSFICIYIILSLPALFGFGYVIDWTPEATFSQKIKGYVTEGLAANFYLKASISVVISILVSVSWNKRKMKRECP